MTAPSLMQVCGRCGSRWPVALGPAGPVPARWCPTCRGDLLPPVSTAPTHAQPQHAQPLHAQPAPARPAHAQQSHAEPLQPRSRSGLPTGYRWVARMPAPAGDEAPAPRARPVGPTPRYRRNPNWGLPVGPAPVAAQTPSRFQSWAYSAPALMRLAALALALAAAAEAFRYGMLIWNQDHLVGRWVVAISDAASLLMGVVAPVMVLIAAVSAIAWLIGARADHYARAGWRDPRSARSLFLGGLLPVWNLVRPGVYLTELAMLREPESAAEGGPGLPPTGAVAARRTAATRLREFGARFQRTFAAMPMLWLVRLWWGMWVLTNITFVGVVLARLDTSMQGRANGVLFTLYANLLALAVAVLTIKVMDRLSSRRAAREPEPARWLIAT